MRKRYDAVGLWAVRRTQGGCAHCGHCPPNCKKTCNFWLTLSGYKWSNNPDDRLVFGLRSQAVYWLRRMRRYYPCRDDGLMLVRVRPPETDPGGATP